MTWRLRVKSTTWASASWTDIKNPTSDITITRTSTRTKHILYDGSLARTIHSGTKDNFDDTVIEWGYLSGTDELITLLSGAVDGGYSIEFRTSDLASDTTYKYISGYIVGIPNMYKLGLFPTADGYQTMHDIVINFDIVRVGDSAVTD